MRIEISASSLSGQIQVPPSKSCFQRACACALVRHGKSAIRFGGISEDERAALHIIRQLGADITVHGDTFEICSQNISPQSHTIHCRESGLSARMFAVLASTCAAELAFTVEKTLRLRPFDSLWDILSKLDVQVKSERGAWPIILQGPMHVKDVVVDASVSSQFITGLVLAYGSRAAKNKRIELLNPVSIPYLQLTLQIMKHFHLKTPEWRDHHTLWFDHTEPEMHELTVHYETEADWSSAAMLCVAAALYGDIVLQRLNASSLQPDIQVLSALDRAGVAYHWYGDDLLIKKCHAIRAFEFDAAHCPDLFPPLAALAAYADGTSIIHGVRRLMYKESNRAESLQREFDKLGINLTIQKDSMYIRGGGALRQCRLFSHNDHRIAMALTIAAMGSSKAIELDGASCIRKSYPNFYSDLLTLGANIQRQEYE